MQESLYTLIDPVKGTTAFKIWDFETGAEFEPLQRQCYYSIIWVKSGKGRLNVDFSEYDFGRQTLFFFSPYQPYKLTPFENLQGTAICFHSDFFCLHTHQKEIACNGILFNNIYESPFLQVVEKDQPLFGQTIEQMSAEIQNKSLAQHELLVSYLKIFLINASRAKVAQCPLAKLREGNSKEPFILQNLKDAIEEHYRSERAPTAYADMLNISPKALAKLARNYFNKTLTDLIAERIVIEAKRELYLTSKSVKEIAFYLGFNDEYYFSRFFKNNTDVSPQYYRERVGFAKGEK